MQTFLLDGMRMDLSELKNPDLSIVDALAHPRTLGQGGEKF